MSKILICTGIYPPRVGGPAQYALEIEKEFKSQGHKVRVITYRLERFLPPLIRHELFFWRTLFLLPGVDLVIALDTFSVGWPAAMAARLMGKKIIVRVGGDFLWESYVERTGDLVLFSNFYRTRKDKLNWKERTVFGITLWTLHNMKAVIFSTAWQKRIFEEAYSLDSGKNFIVENFYGEKLPPVQKKGRVFVAGTRQLKWKNLERLKAAFAEAQKVDPTISLDLSNAPYQEFLQKIREGYAVILTSLGDISPNMILDALRSNTPFVLTRENGLDDRLGSVGMRVDPENIDDIKRGILALADRATHAQQKAQVEGFRHAHNWQQITHEFLAVANKINE